MSQIHPEISKSSHFAVQLEQKGKMRSFCAVRSQQRKFGISFVVPDRLVAEITDKKKVWGKHPMRITRVPSGGPSEFHNTLEQAQKESQPLKSCHDVEATRPNPKKAYHRSHMNDWHTKVSYPAVESLVEE